MRRVLGVVLLGGIALAGEEGPKLDLTSPTKWKVGETVTAKVVELTETRVLVEDASNGREGATRLEATFVQRCLEATPEGGLARSLLRIDAWSMGPVGGSSDRTLEGALVETTSQGWSIVATKANPSRAARKWLENRFGQGRGFCGGLAELGAPAPVAAGAAWTASPPAIARGLAVGGLPIEVDPGKWKFTVELVASSAGTATDGAMARVSFDETIPVEGESRSGDRTLTVGPGSAILVHGEVSAVPGAWHRTGHMRTVAEKTLQLEIEGKSVQMTLAGEESEDWSAGGEPPVLPAVKADVHEIGLSESWHVADAFAESGTEHRTQVTTPVGADGKDAAAKREEETVTWKAEVECLAADDGAPTSAVVVFTDWKAVHGEETDASLAGAIVRLTGAQWKIASSGTSASGAAKSWLTAHFAANESGGDGLRAAVSPAMRVALKQSWSSDPNATAAALQRRFRYPMGQVDGVHGTGTLLAVEGSGGAARSKIAYEVESAISCVPGCSGAGADILKGTISAKGTAEGPDREWARLGSLSDETRVAVTLPPRSDDESRVRIAIAEERRIARSALVPERRSALSWTEAASARVDRKDFAGAAADATRAIERDPSVANAWFQRARAKAGLDDAKGSIADYTKAIEVDPTSSAAYLNRGLQLRAEGDLDAALADFSKAIEISPKYVLAWRQRSRARTARGDLEGAIADATKAIELSPRSADAYADRARAHHERGEYGDAAWDFTHAIQLAPKSAAHLVGRANAKAAMDDFDGALTDFERAIEIDPKDARTLYDRARTYREKGDLVRALADLDKALEAAPRAAYVWTARGDLRWRLGDEDGALADWQKSMEVDPKRSATHMSLARRLFQPGLPTSPALEQVRAALETSKDQDYERLWLWLVRARAGETEAATKELETHAAARKGNAHDDWYRVLVGLLAGRTTEDAARAAAKVEDPTKSRQRLCEAAFYSGMIRALHGEIEKAVQLLDASIASDVRTYVEYDEAGRWRRALLLGGTTRKADDAGARVLVSPDPHGPAARAGFRDGDRISAIDGVPLTAGKLDEVLGTARCGAVLRLDVARGAEKLRVEVTLGDWKP